MTGLGTIATYAFLFTVLFFEVFLLVSFLERRFTKVKVRNTSPRHSAPSVAIIVPCFNETRTVRSTLDSLLTLSYPTEKLEILVVDDGSVDGTADTVLQYAQNGRVKLLRKENGGKHTAMNLALAHTNAEFIGCLDADSTVDPLALARIIPMFEDERVAAVTPGIHVHESKTFFQHIQNVEYRLSIFNRFMFSALGSAFITPGPFSIFRTSVVKELGGWRHGHSTEDMEMALRIQKAGYAIENAPTAIVRTRTPRSLKALFRQRVRWTYGFLRNAFDYRHMLGNRSYGNLGLLILPLALISIASALYFFLAISLHGIEKISNVMMRVEILGVSFSPSFDAFFIDTSAVLLVTFLAIILVLALISLGSLLSLGRHALPYGTPLFVVCYGFLAPLWLGTALVRAIFKTGVDWR